MVDSGASVSVINQALVKCDEIIRGRPVQVQSFDGTRQIYDEWVKANVSYQGRRVNIDALVVKGCDYKFLLSRPDMKTLKLNLYWNDEVTVAQETCASLNIADHLVKCEKEVREKFPELVCLGNYPPATTKFTVPFKLRDVTPVRKKPYSMSREKKLWLKTEIQNMLDAGIIRPSVSTFASPITLAPKEDGSLRLCTDYRILNNQTDLFPFPMPRIDEIIEETGGCKIFSRIDLCKGFWQIPLEEKYKMYTAFVTPFDVYEYNRLPFGWKNSAAWFQKMMNSVLKPFLGLFCNVYVDDIIVYSKDETSHAEHLTSVLMALRDAKLKVNFKKSEFFKHKITFLGRILDGFTKSTKEESVERVRRMKKPDNVHAIRVFLGLAGHFRSYIKDFAARAKPLNNLLRKDTDFIWTEECEKAYKDLVLAISSDPILTLPDFTVPFELTTDASNYGAGAVLYQRRGTRGSERERHVVGYYSYTFTKAEQNYSTTEKEALAVVLAIRYFRSYLEGAKFKLFTDHLALTHLLNGSQPKGRVARWISEIQQFDFEVAHRSGQDLSDADALSRLPIASNCENDETVNSLTMWEGTEELMYADGRFYVPDTLRTRLLGLYHDSPESGGHDGFWRTYNKMRRRFTWPGMKKYINDYISSCPQCQMNKAKYKQKTDSMIFPPYSEIPFETVHVDFAELKKKAKE